ncbi:MAG: PD40 domain-containing protein, partial [Lentisphaerae bacterium]|nr:PD40 domain-containing protein [Lentisphaerota bacterium]
MQVALGDIQNVCAGLLLAAALGVMTPSAGRAAEITVSAGGNIQTALNSAQAGDTVTVRAGTYYEKLTFPRSGSAADGWITLRATPGETPILDGTGVSGPIMVLIDGQSFIRVSGFEIRNNTGLTDGSGIRVLGASRNIEILTNAIHDMRGVNAMAITVYGTSATAATNIVIRGNHVYDCEPATSEAITLNGNISGFEVASNLVHDVNNIGIDFIGGEADISPDGVCRNGVCRGNRVYRARSNYGGGYAAGIYVDGGKDIVIEQNTIAECDVGIEIGAENAGVTVTGVIVRANLIFNNDKAGLGFGGYDQALGRVQGCRFLNNDCYKNDTLQTGNGELWIQWSSGNVVENNIFYCGPQGRLINSPEGNEGNALDYNLWFHEQGAASAVFDWNGTTLTGYDAYRAATGQDAGSLFSNPAFVAVAVTDFHASALSPVIDAGNPATASAGETDFDGQPRVADGRIDMGAYETQSGDRSDGAERLYLPEAPASAQNPAFSPDGQTLLFTLFHSGYNTGQAGLYRLSLTGTNPPSAVLDEAGQASVNLPGTAWNGALNRITFASDRVDRDEIWTLAPDGSSLSRVTTHFTDTFYIEPSFSSNGEWIVFESRPISVGDESPGNIVKIKTDGTGLTTLTDFAITGFDDRQPNWSPRGDRILFQRRLSGSDNWDLYTMNPDGSDIRQVTTSAGSDTDASWSPDGSWIVYSSDYGGLAHPSIFVIAATGGTPVRVTNCSTNEDGAPSWSPDGNWIVFESHVTADETSRSALWRFAALSQSSVSSRMNGVYVVVGVSDLAFWDPASGKWFI